MTNITIRLTPNEYDGIKKYLFDTDGKRATKKDVRDHIQQIVSGYINAPHNAESDYIIQD
jgi:hypothetical protein